MSHRNFTIGKLFLYKDRQSLLHSSGVVYQLTCSCGQNYIGQTKRNLITRLNEHRTCEDSEVCKHLLNNPSHVINFDSPKILDRSNHVTQITHQRNSTYFRNRTATECRQSIFAPVSFQCLIVLNCCLK